MGRRSASGMNRPDAFSRIDVAVTAPPRPLRPSHVGNGEISSFRSVRDKRASSTEHSTNRAHQVFTVGVTIPQAPFLRRDAMTGITERSMRRRPRSHRDRPPLFVKASRRVFQPEAGTHPGRISPPAAPRSSGHHHFSPRRSSYFHRRSPCSACPPR